MSETTSGAKEYLYQLVKCNRTRRLKFFVGLMLGSELCSHILGLGGCSIIGVVATLPLS